MHALMCDGRLIAKTAAGDISIVKGECKAEINVPAKISIVLSADNPYRHAIQKRLSSVELTRNDGSLWHGQMTASNEDISGNVTYLGVSELSYLFESIQEPISFTGSAANLFTQLLAAHNTAVSVGKQIKKGDIIKSGLGASLTVETTNPETTWRIISDLVEEFGGILQIRHSDDGAAYLDWLDDSGVFLEETIEYGKNLIDIEIDDDTDDVYTCLRYACTYGAGDAQTTEIKSIQNTDGVAAYGKIWAEASFEAATETEADEAAVAYLAELAKKTRAISAKAYDTGKFPARCGDFVRVKMPLRWIDEWMIVAAVQSDLTGGKPPILQLGKIPAAISAKADKIEKTNAYLRTLAGRCPSKGYAVDANSVRAKAGGNYAVTR